MFKEINLGFSDVYLLVASQLSWSNSLFANKHRPQPFRPDPQGTIVNISHGHLEKNPDNNDKHDNNGRSEAN